MAELSAEADRGRHPGYPSFNVLAGGPGSLAVPLGARTMRSQRRRMAATAGVFVLLFGASWLAGCGTSSSPSGGAGDGSVSWLRFKEINPKAGIDEAEASYGMWGDGMAFVILSDVVGSSGARSSGGTGQPSRYRGYQESPDGRKVEWQCETPDGKTGTITISGQSYDLAQGSLFLVATKGGGSRVLQLKRDTLKLTGQERLEHLLKDDTDVGQFFVEAAKPK